MTSPRAVVGVLGSLLASKLSFGTFVAPGIALLLTTPAALRARLWVLKKLLCKPDDYVIRLRLDLETSSVVMLMEIPLALGFCFPVLFPLAFLAFTLNATVFQYSKLPLEFNCTPHTRYLWVSASFGAAFQAWLVSVLDTISH